MRILQLISSSGFYGAEKVVLLLSRDLARLGCGLTLGLFHAGSQGAQSLASAARAHGIPVRTLPGSGPFSPRAAVRLARLLREEQIDLLHTHGYKADLYGAAACAFTPCIMLSTCHGWTGRSRKLRLYERLDRAALRSVSRAIAVSGPIADTLRHSGLRPERVAIIGTGIDTAHYAQPSRACDVAGAPPIIGCLSRLSPEKGVDVLVTALPGILRQFPHARCVVAGEGPERARLALLAAQLGVGDRVSFPGHCDDTASFLARCSLFVLPSRTEGLPLALLEAMASGLAPVATSVGGVPSVLRHGETGLLIPPDDPAALAGAVLHLLASPATRMRMGALAAAHACRHYDSAATAHSYLQVYRELLAPRMQGAGRALRSAGSR